MTKVNLIMLIFFAAGSVFASLAKAEDFDGTFSNINSSDPLCDEVFAKREYFTKHFRVGSAGTVSVLYFAKDTEAPGFFTELSLVGNYGYGDEIYARKKVERDGRIYSILSEGFVYTVLYVEMSVRVADKSKPDEILCTTTAEYLGMHY